MRCWRCGSKLAVGSRKWGPYSISCWSYDKTVNPKTLMKKAHYIFKNKSYIDFNSPEDGCSRFNSQFETRRLLNIHTKRKYDITWVCHKCYRQYRDPLRSIKPNFRTNPISTDVCIGIGEK